MDEKKNVFDGLSVCLILLDCAGTREECKRIVMEAKAFVEDAEKVVRCKDCWKRHYDNCPFNEFCGYEPEDDFFCGEGQEVNE